LTNMPEHTADTVDYSGVSGVINIYKEKGYTSHDVVAVVRGLLNRAKTGHTGTLDPDAEGVLPVCVGRATKLADRIAASDKSYTCALVLGAVTDTYDTSGALTARRPDGFADIDAAFMRTVSETVSGFMGPQEQTPPMYSAIKVGGRKLYELARKGISVERAPRQIDVLDIKITSAGARDIAVGGETCRNFPVIGLEVTCSKGTYIRSLCFDIGERLELGGCMADLVRTRSGAFDVKDSVRLSELKALVAEGRLSERLIPPERLTAYFRIQ